jgi:serine/threonine protein kinase
MKDNKINCIFNNLFKNIILNVNKETTIQELINLYFEKMGKGNLVDENIEKTYFLYNGLSIDYKDNKETVDSFFNNQIQINIDVRRLEYNKNFRDYTKTRTIKDNIYTCVEEAKVEGQLVAVKKIKKERIKEDIKEDLCTTIVTKEDFKPHVDNFNKELLYMQLCHCENTVEIYDYYDTEKEFVIIMELCDDTLLNELAKTQNGFSTEKIKEIFIQLNNAFKIMHKNKISHRDIKLNNILVKYLNNEKTQFKVLLSDFGISNQLNKLTTHFSTKLGTRIIMAPEILKGEKYNDKCDLWSLGVNIYKLKTKDFPYKGKVDIDILNQINEIGQKVLYNIDNRQLRNLLSKLLVANPENRISWDEYFEDPFFN